MWNGPQRRPGGTAWPVCPIARNSLVGPTWPVVAQAAPIRCGEGPIKLLWGVAVAALDAIFFFFLVHYSHGALDVIKQVSN